ncbi:MAG TPA: protein kinase, partial [Oligoflexia bacterium]|nr:protein kinase [Oligoflexia bacterium]
MDDSLKQDPFIGTVIDGKYRIVEKIGHGGIGAVYRGEHTLIRRQVAIKVLHSHLVENEDFLRRFRHEAEIASSLTHPNAVILYDYGVEQSRP